MHLPATTIRTQVMLPRRFADGFGTTERPDEDNAA